MVVVTTRLSTQPFMAMFTSSICSIFPDIIILSCDDVESEPVVSQLWALPNIVGVHVTETEINAEERLEFHQTRPQVSSLHYHV